MVGVYINANSEVRTVVSKDNQMVSVCLTSPVQNIPVKVEGNTVSEMEKDQHGQFVKGEFTLHKNEDALWAAICN